MGAVVGLPAFAVFRALGLPFIVNSPMAAALTPLLFGTVAGLMLGGLVRCAPKNDASRPQRQLQ